jgi:pimeloyl-ACP methyl ester carboxylesterase
MNSSQIYFHNFDLIDPKKKSILFIPGAGMDHRFIRALSFPESEYNLPLVIDLPGHGGSHGASSNNIQFYSKFLIELLKSYNLNNLVLCGHSMGGLIAIDMLIHHSYPAKSLILLNSIYPIKVSKFLIEKAKISNSEASSFIIKYGLYKRLIGIKNIFPQKEALVMLDDLEACNNYQLSPSELKSLDLPVSIILGSKDKLVDLKELENFVNHVSSKTYTIDESGHFPFFECPDELSRLMLSLV